SCAPLVVLLIARTAEDAVGLADAVLRAGMSQPPAMLAILQKGRVEARIQVLEAGVAEVLVRPVERAELVIRVGTLVRSQQAVLTARGRAAELERLLQDRTAKLEEAVEILRTAERRFADQLAASRAESRGKSELMASAAHELRTPLHAIIGFSDLVRTEAYGPLGDPRYAEYAADIHQAATHLLSMVDGTLDLAKAESGQEELEFRRVDVGRVVQDSARMLSHLAGSAGVVLDVNIPPTPLVIRTDPEKVRQVVLNLASNAIKFTPRGGRVAVEVQADVADGAIIMVIRDTGIGMAAKDIPTALKPFGQIRQPDRPHPKGTGLGLPLTRRFVEMLGGHLDISSKPGLGTVVTVRLPADGDKDGTKATNRAKATAG
ncbi:MAG: non-motile and phage-resistance protein, partial [Pseudomonadota bacterium]